MNAIETFHAYAAVIFAIAVIVFKRKMNSDN